MGERNERGFGLWNMRIAKLAGAKWRRSEDASPEPETSGFA